MNKNTLLTIALTAVLVFTAAFAVFGDTNAGSAENPLVTKDYVDTRLTYQTVHVLAGQRIIGGAGAEIILRSGEATAIDNGANGVSDITSGTDLMSGMQVGLNHLLLIPRDDGRGIAASTEGWIMVRGDFTIE